MTPMFSVIIPVYRVEAYLPACVDSILAQSFADFELILVVDGAGDRCGVLCDGYAARDGRVTVIHQPNRGVTAARRAGLERAQGEYICFVDGDDWVREDWLTTLARCIRENGGPDMVLDRFITDDGQPGPPFDTEPGYYDKARLEREVYPYMLWDRRRPFLQEMVPGYVWGKAFRRELVLAHYLDDADAPLTMFEDTAMVYECLYHARSFYYCPECLYVYRLWDGSVMGRFDPEALPRMQRSREYLLSHLVRQAPETAEQVDAFFAGQLVRQVGICSRHGGSLRRASKLLASGLARTDFAGALDTKCLPVRIRLFLFPLRHRASTTAVLVYRTRLWLYAHRPGGKGGD